MADPLTIGLGIAGMAVQAVGSVVAGKQAEDDAKYEAAQMEANARARQAEASRTAYEKDRQRKIAMSKARAIGAASGGGRDYNLEQDIDAEGEYAVMSALWEGEEGARSWRDRAAARRYDGKVAKRAGFIRAGTSIVKGGTSLLDKYGGALDEAFS